MERSSYEYGSENVPFPRYNVLIFLLIDFFYKNASADFNDIFKVYLNNYQKSIGPIRFYSEFPAAHSGRF